MSDAWAGDWRARVFARLSQLGIDSLTAFADARPHLSLARLAQELNCSAAGIQLETVLREEACRADRFDDFVRSSLVRCIHTQMPAGWGLGEKADFRRASAYARFR